MKIDHKQAKTDINVARNIVATVLEDCRAFEVKNEEAAKHLSQAKVDLQHAYTRLILALDGIMRASEA